MMVKAAPIQTGNYCTTPSPYLSINSVYVYSKTLSVFIFYTLCMILEQNQFFDLIYIYMCYDSFKVYIGSHFIFVTLINCMLCYLFVLFPSIH